jgi:hypothetical protein
VDVIKAAHRRGWELEETYRAGRYVFRWVGALGARDIQFGTEAEAVSWMRQWLADRPRP